MVDGETTVVQATRLGLTGSDGDFRGGLTFVGRTDGIVADDYAMVTGKEEERSYAFQESVFEFENADGGRFSIAVRLSDDGAAYRYLVAGEGSTGSTTSREPGSSRPTAPPGCSARTP